MYFERTFCFGRFFRWAEYIQSSLLSHCICIHITYCNCSLSSANQSVDESLRGTRIDKIIAIKECFGSTIVCAPPAISAFVEKYCCGKIRHSNWCTTTLRIESFSGAFQPDLSRLLRTGLRAPYTAAGTSTCENCHPRYEQDLSLVGTSSSREEFLNIYLCRGVLEAQISLQVTA